MMIGLIGAPNHGKSTLFNALTMAGAEVASRPFTTIKPNEGVGYVRVKSLREDESPVKGYSKDGNRFIPIRLLDVAGLVPGASEGRGLGNQFMNDLVQADAFILVVDASGSTDEEGSDVTGYGPMKVVEVILKEVNDWFYLIVERNWETVRKKDKPLKLLAEKLSGLGIKDLDVKAAGEIGDDLKAFSKKLLSISKPYIIAANKADKGCKLDSEPVSAIIELTLRDADAKGFISYVPGERSFKVIKELSDKQEQGLAFVKLFLDKQSTGVQELINRLVFDVLKCVVVYPVMDEHKWTDVKGNVLPDAHLMPAGSTALDLAYKVHNDIGNGFIKAIDCKTHKALGKDYVLKNNDVIKILSH